MFLLKNEFSLSDGDTQTLLAGKNEFSLSDGDTQTLLAGKKIKNFLNCQAAGVQKQKLWAWALALNELPGGISAT